jgi:hypothetical protein
MLGLVPHDEMLDPVMAVAVVRSAWLVIRSPVPVVWIEPAAVRLPEMLGLLERDIVPEARDKLDPAAVTMLVQLHALLMYASA